MTERAVHIGVFIAALATLAIVVVVSQIRETDIGRAIEHRLLARGDDPSHVDVALELVERLRGLNDASLAEFARNYAVETNPIDISRIARELVRRHTPDEGRIAVFLMEAAAERYKLAYVLTWVGWEFYQGRYVERDFAKAARMLGDPRLRASPRAIYRLGRVLLDDRNPEGDPLSGRALIEKAANQGYKAAIRWLERISS